MYNLWVLQVDYTLMKVIDIRLTGGADAAMIKKANLCIITLQEE